MGSRGISWKQIIAPTACVTIIVVVFALPQLRVFPLMDGGFYFPLGSNMIPYRDYFLPVTPLTYFEAQIFEKSSNPLLVNRLFFLWIPVAMFWSYFMVSRQFLNTLRSCVVAIFGVGLFATLGLELLGGWNTQGLALEAMGLAMSVLAFSTPNSTKARAIGYGLWAGAFFGLAIQAKQTFAIVNFVICLGLLGWFCVGARKRSESRRRGLGVVSAILVGLTSVTLISLMLLMKLGALGAFFSTMLSGGGKNPSLLSALAQLQASISEGLSNSGIWAVALLLLLGYFALSQTPKGLGKSSRVVVQCLWFFALGLVGFQTFIAVVGTPEIWAVPWSLLVLLMGMISVRMAARYRQIAPVILAVLVPLLIGLLISPTGINAYLIYVGLPTKFWLILSIAMMIWMSYFCIRMIPPTRRTEVQLSLGFDDAQSISVFIGVLATFASLVGLLSSGVGLWVQSLLPGICILIAACWHLLSRTSGLAWTKLIVYALLVLVGVSGFLTTLTRPYTWWGWTEPSVLDGSRVKANFAYLKDLDLAVSTNDFYTRLASAEERAAGLSGQSSPTLLTFPNATAGWALTNLEPYTASGCIWLWMDLCPNSLALEALRNVRRTPPSVIVWNEVPEEAITLHESAFVHESSAVRDWIKFRNEQVAIGRWVAVDEIPATKGSPNQWPVTIYYTIDHSNLEGPNNIKGSLTLQGQIEPNGAAVSLLSTGDAWYWLEAGGTFHVHIVSSGTSSHRGNLEIQLQKPSCLVFDRPRFTTNTGINIEGISTKSELIEIPYDIRPGESVDVSLTASNSGCRIGSDPRKLAAKLVGLRIS